MAKSAGRGSLEFRFAVGSSDGPRSHSWKVWSTGDEVYCAQRCTGRYNKFSFHRSGVCRWALLTAPADGRDRLIKRWERNSVSSPGTLQGSMLIGLTFPSNHLSTDLVDSKGALHWISPAAAGRATVVEIFLTNERPDDVKTAYADDRRGRVLAFAPLSGGHHVGIASLEIDCGPIDLTIPRDPVLPGQVFGELVFPDQDDTSGGRPVRMVLAKDAGPTGKWVQAFELGGYHTIPISQ